MWRKAFRGGGKPPPAHFIREGRKPKYNKKKRAQAQAAAQFVGTHDFAAVRSVGTETRTTVRTVHYFDIQRRGQIIDCRVWQPG